MTNTFVISGCGPGSTYPADTPQEGARSVDSRLVPSEAIALHVSVERAVLELRRRRVLSATDYTELYRILQKAADKAAWLAVRA